MVRPLKRLVQLRDYDRLCLRLREMVKEGLSAKEMVVRLNAEGYHSPRRQEGVSLETVKDLIRRLGLHAERSHSKRRKGLGNGEWWLPVLADRLGVPYATMYDWVEHGWVRGRRQGSGTTGRWVVWADEGELERLRELRCRYGRDRSLEPQRERPASGSDSRVASGEAVQVEPGRRRKATMQSDNQSQSVQMGTTAGSSRRSPDTTTPRWGR